MSKKYSINVHSTKKVMEIAVTGTFTPDDANAFVSEYKHKVSTIQPETYVLELDCTTMDLVTPAMTPELEYCYNLYKESGFFKVLFKIKANPLLKLQLKRLARGTGLKQAEVVAV